MSSPESLREAICCTVFGSRNMLNFKIEQSDQCKLSSNKSTLEICSRHVELVDQGVGIQFYYELDVIQPELCLFQYLQQTMAFSLSSIILLFHLTPYTTLVSHWISSPCFWVD